MTTSDEGEVHLKCGAFQKQLTLTWEQRGMLTDRQDRDRQHVLVAGPPGTGKTTVLLCKGLEWLQQGKDVLVCSIHRASIPPSCYVETVLSEAKQAHDSARCPEGGEAEWGQVKYCDCVLPDDQAVQSCLDYVVSFKSADRLMNLLFDYMQPETLSLCQVALDFIKQLRGRLPESQIWASDWFSTLPEGFFEERLSKPLRYTQQLFPHINVPVQTLELTGKVPGVYTYNTETLQVPSGPDVIHVRHKAKFHDEKWPIHSYACGQKVAKILRHIGVGSSAAKEGSKGDNDAGKGDHYQFRDVLVITRNEVKGGVAPAFARGLEDAGIPTRVFSQGDHLTVEEALTDVIRAPEDKVIVTNNEVTTGLDRKVVVCLTGVGKDDTWEVTDEEDQQIRTNEYPAATVTAGGVTVNLTLDMTPEQQQEFRQKLLHAHRSEAELVHRLTIWTRCSRQLVIVHLPESVQGLRAFKIRGLAEKKCTIL